MDFSTLLPFVQTIIGAVVGVGAGASIVTRLERSKRLDATRATAAGEVYEAAVNLHAFTDLALNVLLENVDVERPWAKMGEKQTALCQAFDSFYKRKSLYLGSGIEDRCEALSKATWEVQNRVQTLAAESFYQGHVPDEEMIQVSDAPLEQVKADVETAFSDLKMCLKHLVETGDTPAPKTTALKRLK